MQSRDSIVEEARRWLGVPWLHQGRTKLGVDCAGLVVLVAKKLGLSEYDNTSYQRRALGSEFLRQFGENMDQKPVAEACPGDVLVFRDAAFPCHAAVVGERDGELTLIHAHAMRRRVVEERLGQGDWMARRVACYAFRGVED